MKFKRKNLDLKQLFQFLIVGGLNALIDIGSLNIFLSIWPTTDDRLLVLFNTLAYLLAILNSYFWNSRITFRSHAQNSLREKAYFFMQAGISLILSNITFFVSLQILEDFYLPALLVQNLSKVLAMAVPSSASFLFMKYFVFGKLQKER